MPQFAPTLLRRELDRVPLWRGDHVSVKQLWEDFARYLYLPRLKGSEVLLQAIRDGTSMLTWDTKAFAYAEGWDEERGRYRGLRAESTGVVLMDGQSVIVKPEAARRQLDAARELDAVRPEGSRTVYIGDGQRETAIRIANGGSKAGPAKTSPPPPITPAVLGRFHGSVALDVLRLGRDAGTIAEEIVQHLSTLPGAKLEITLEIQATMPDGAPENVVRTITENCRTLKFKSYGFEER